MKFNIEEKLETTVNTLSNWRCVKKILPIPTTYKEIDSNKIVLPSSLRGFKKFESPYILTKEEKYYWFHAEFDIENIQKNQKVYLSIETFLNYGASTIRPQGLLYLNGELIQGIDINHTDVLIKKSGKYEMFLHFYTHSFGFSIPLYFSLKYIDARTESIYYDFFTILDSLKMLNKDDPKYINALPIIDNAINIIDFRKFDSDLFYKSIDESKKYLYENFFTKFCGKEKRYINCVGHSHIDVAWLWDFDQTRQKVQRTFSTALKLMDEYPEYKYFHTTPQVFDFLKEDNPTLYKKVKQKINEKRFEVDGAMWLEADCNLTSGESLVRQLVYGQEFFKKEFNVDCTTLFLPDVFGYSSQLPQLLIKSGIKRFVTAKIGWNDTNRFPYDSFNWAGLDGSKVFTYLITTCNANPRIGVKDTTYTDYVGKINASQLLGVWNRYQNKDINTTTLCTFGWGDGGGGPTREMIECEKRFEYGLPGLGKTRISSFKDTVDEIERNCLNNKNKIPTWNGELYFEYHRGTYTSVPRIKYNNRKFENLLQLTEILLSFSNILYKTKYEDKCIKNLWKLLLLNQFHDVLPGSSIKKVYDDSNKHFKKLDKEVSTIIENNINSFVKNIYSNKKYVVFNSNSFKTDLPVKINGKTYVVSDVPPIGYKCFDIPKNQIHIIRQDKYLENKFYIIKFDDYGNIVSLIDKHSKKDFVKNNCKFNQLICYEDMPYQYDNWELTPYHKEKAYHFDELAKFNLINDGERIGFEIIRPYFESVVIQKVYIYESLKRIDFETKISWKEKRQILKVVFPTSLKSKDVIYETQFGNIKRTSVPQNSFDEAKFECCGQRFVDIFDDKYGLALINNAKYGFSAEKNVLSMSLLKSGSFPFDGASDDIPEFIYSLIPHDGDYRSNHIVEDAYIVNRPPLVFKVDENHSKINNDEFSLLSIDKNGVYIDTIKKAENGDGIIVRIYEAFGEKHDINLSCYKDIKQAYSCNLKEEEIEELNLNKNKIQISIKPFEVVTIRLTF